MIAIDSVAEHVSSSILIIDDHPTNIGFVVIALEERGHRVFVARNGEEGLLCAARVCPDLILLDVMMPGMDGFLVCRQLKAQQATRDIPVIFMTALTDMGNKLTAFEAGAVDYVTKPLQIDEVIARAETQLRLGIMHKRLEAQNAELEAHRDELERLVAERTGDLDASNRQLQDEVVERRKAQDELTAREREFRTLAEHLPDSIARYDQCGRILYCNPAFESTLNSNSVEVLGMTPLEVIPGQACVEYHQYLMETMATGLPSEFELRLSDKGDGVVFHHILIVAERETDDSVNGALAIGRDITSRKRAERELVLLNRALDQAFDAVYLLDADMKVRYANKAAMHTLGYTYEELLSLNLFDIDPHISQQKAQGLVGEVTKYGRLQTTVESLHRRKNGETFPVEVGGSTFKYEGETLFLTTVRDISERKEAECLLHEQQEALHAALDNAPDAIARYDHSFKRIYVNTTMQRRLGVSGEQLIGKSPDEFSPMHEPERYIGLLQHVFDTGEELQDELSFSALGSERWVELRCAPEFNAAGEVVSVLMFGRDVTSRHLMERENALLKTMADSAAEVMVFAHALDAHAGLPFIYANPGFAQHLGHDIEEMRNLCVTDVTDYSLDEIAAHMDTLREKKSLHFETEHIRKNGERIPVEVMLTYFTHDGEELVAGYCMDISKRKEHERKLHASEKKFRTLAENLPDNIVRYDRSRRVIYANPKMQRQLEIIPDHKPGGRLYDAVSAERYLNTLKEVVRTGEPKSVEVEAIGFHGGKEIHQISFVAERTEGNDIQGALAIGRDITAIKEAERRLQESHTQLQNLARHIETVREEERKHIARELHDDLGQYLTALRLQVSALNIEFGDDDGVMAQRLRQLLDLTDSTKHVVRNLSQQIRPAVLDMGVFPALNWLVDEFQSHSGIACKLTIDDNDMDMPDNCATAVFRVVQESLTNVTRHADAGSVSVLLHRQADFYVLEISDDGKGFVPDEKRAGAFGLVGMRERLIAVGGRLTITSAPEHGTCITAQFPATV